MNRVLLGSAAALIGLGVAAVAFDADMLIGPRGAPLMVEAPGSLALQPASFDGTCTPDLLFSDTSPDDAGARIVGLTVRGGGLVVSVASEEQPSDAPPMLLVFDSADKLLAAGTPDELLPLLPEIAAPCAPAPEADRLVAPI